MNELEEKIQRAANKVMTKFQGGLEIKNLDSVEAIEAEIKMLQSKLEFYKELEKQPKTLFDVIRNLGYSCDACYEIVDAIEEFEKQKEKEMIKKNLKTSIQEMGNKEESWMDKPVEELVKVLEKNPPECLKFEMGKSLRDLIYRWWCDVFTTHSDWDMETSIDDLVDQIQLWLPKEQSAAGSQNMYVECSVEGFNEAILKIKSKLR